MCCQSAADKSGAQLSNSHCYCSLRRKRDLGTLDFVSGWSFQNANAKSNANFQCNVRYAPKAGALPTNNPKRLVTSWDLNQGLIDCWHLSEAALRTRISRMIIRISPPWTCLTISAFYDPRILRCRLPMEPQPIEAVGRSQLTVVVYFVARRFSQLHCCSRSTEAQNFCNCNTIIAHPHTLCLTRSSSKTYVHS